MGVTYDNPFDNLHVPLLMWVAAAPPVPSTMEPVETKSGALEMQSLGHALTPPTSAEVLAAEGATVEHLIIVDFEGTCDSSDDGLTRLQQCDIHEIIEFPAVWIAARGEEAGAEIAYFREYVKPVEGTTAEGQARTLSAFCEYVAHCCRHGPYSSSSERCAARLPLPTRQRPRLCTPHLRKPLPALTKLHHASTPACTPACTPAQGEPGLALPRPEALTSTPAGPEPQARG